MTISDVKDVATIAGVVTGVVALVFTAINTRMTLRTNRAKFWLDLRDRFGKHDEVHRRLRPGGAWADGGAPATPDEWAQVEAYMGLFEHCDVMLEDGLIDETTFRKIYAYRLNNIVGHDVIRREKLIKRAAGWSRFIALAKRMGVDIAE